MLFVRVTTSWTWNHLSVVWLYDTTNRPCRGLYNKRSNTLVQSLSQAKGVCHVTVNVGNHNRQCLIEGFNTPLQNIIAFYQEYTKTNQYVNVLQYIVFDYNRIHHCAVGDIAESRYESDPSSGSIKTNTANHSINVGNCVGILNGQTFE